MRGMMIVATVFALAGLACRAAAVEKAPATQPVVKAEDTEGELLGVLAVGKRYDSKTGTVTLRIAFGNKTSKRMKSVSGFYSLTPAWALTKEQSGLVSYSFAIAEPIEPGAVQTKDIVVTRLPSDTDAEIAASNGKVGSITAAHIRGAVIRFEDGTSRRVGDLPPNFK